MGASIQPAVVGATGYTGAELARLLSAHPRVRTPLLLGGAADGGGGEGGAAAAGGDLARERFSWERVKAAGVDTLFLCTPHEASRALVPEAIKRGYRVVDLSGAWRLKSAAHRAVYGFEDADPGAASGLTASAVYGLPELHAHAIADARLVANAGCYATSIILALAPWIQAGLIDLGYGVISDSKSGVSGAGKQPTPRTHFVEVSNNLSTYSVFGHRHTGEVLEQLGLAPDQFQFTPHLLPIPRGILSTIYVRAAARVGVGELEQCLRDFYAEKPFVRVFGPSRLPEIKFSLNTNYCDIGFAMESDGARVVLVSCLDNLMKGAAGQSVQNMNTMFGWNEREGLQ
jgi:N-acetyl-gamma-glutamyl-phosphate reductase